MLRWVLCWVLKWVLHWAQQTELARSPDRQAAEQQPMARPEPALARAQPAQQAQQVH